MIDKKIIRSIETEGYISNDICINSITYKIAESVKLLTVTFTCCTHTYKDLTKALLTTAL